MTSAAAQARHLSLVRLEQAAGQALGCIDEAETKGVVRGATLWTPAVFAFATLATALAVTIGYFV